jgi:hypothetical protein
MIKHIVCWTFRGDAGEKRVNLQKARDVLEALNGRIPGMGRMEVGTNRNTTPDAYDLALYSEFESWEALELYQTHPEHQKAVEFLRRVREKRVVVDYEG